MILFSTDMQREKLATIGLVVIIVVALSGFLTFEYGDEISEILFGKPSVEAKDDSYTFFQDSSLNLANVVSNDVYTNLSTLNVEIATQASHGVAVVTGQSIYYTPAQEYLGSDSFTYKIIDENGESSQAKVKINLEIGTVEFGDCVDVHYIGTYADGSIFGYSYEDPINKTGGTPLNIFVSIDDTELPPEDYITYSNLVANQYYVEDFIAGLEGLNIGDTTRIGPISPDESFGVRPVVGDLINLTAYGGLRDLSIYEVQENVDMPFEFIEYFGNITTSFYTLRHESYYIGEIINKYTFWENSSVVTKINETLIWTYITPTTNVIENFTWSETIIDEALGTQFLHEYPTNASQISSMDDDTIIVTHNPTVGSTITVSAFVPEWDTYMAYVTYTVENLTNDKINVSYTDPFSDDGTITYTELDRILTIERNETQNITEGPYPSEVLESLFFLLRAQYPDFNLGTGPFTETVYIDVEIVDIEYKKS